VVEKKSPCLCQAVRTASEPVMQPGRTMAEHSSHSRRWFWCSGNRPAI